jgi:hypothetical protein
MSEIFVVNENGLGVIGSHTHPNTNIRNRHRFQSHSKPIDFKPKDLKQGGFKHGSLKPGGLKL